MKGCGLADGFDQGLHPSGDLGEHAQSQLMIFPHRLAQGIGGHMQQACRSHRLGPGAVAGKPKNTNLAKEALFGKEFDDLFSPVRLQREQFDATLEHEEQSGRHRPTLIDGFIALVAKHRGIAGEQAERAGLDPLEQGHRLEQGDDVCPTFGLAGDHPAPRLSDSHVQAHLVVPTSRIVAASDHRTHGQTLRGTDDTKEGHSRQSARRPPPEGGGWPSPKALETCRP